jgi:hypothetical protein
VLPLVKMEQNGGKEISQVKAKLVVAAVVEVIVDQMDHVKINGEDQTKPKVTRIGRVHMASGQLIINQDLGMNRQLHQDGPDHDMVHQDQVGILINLLHMLHLDHVQTQIIQDVVTPNHIIIQMDGPLDPDGKILMVAIPEGSVGGRHHLIPADHLVDDGTIKQIGMIQVDFRDKDQFGLINLVALMDGVISQNEAEVMEVIGMTIQTV